MTTKWLMLCMAAVLGLAGVEPAGPLTVTARKRVPSPVDTQVKNVDGTTSQIKKGEFAPVTFSKAIDPQRTAIVVCDMWDDHWCKSAAKRCGELARQSEPVLNAARNRGMTIIHAPSDCMKFYSEHPARKRMLAVAKVEPPKGKDVTCPSLPIDDSDGGCDDDKPAKQFRAWTRQHAAITIDPERDYISDSGVEVYSILAAKKINTLIVMGVHTNMCVLNRTFAIKQMVKWGVDVLLIRDLTDAMYNPRMKPFVTHERGTELIIEFIESYWCPTIEARQLLAK